MAIFVERARQVPRGRIELMLWQALADLSSLAWAFAGAGVGLSLGGAIAFLAGGGYLSVLVLTGALGALGGVGGVAVGRRLRRLAVNGCARCAPRVHWITRYGWPAWLTAASVVATVGVCASFWALTTTY